MLTKLILIAMRRLSARDLMEVGETAKILGAKNHQVYFPWIHWSRGDFTPESIDVDGVTEEDTEVVMDLAWKNTLENRHFLELDDDDWARVRWAVYDAVDELGINRNED